MLIFCGRRCGPTELSKRARACPRLGGKSKVFARRKGAKQTDDRFPRDGRWALPREARGSFAR